MGKKAPTSPKSCPPKTTPMDNRVKKRANQTGKHGMVYSKGKYPS